MSRGEGKRAAGAMEFATLKGWVLLVGSTSNSVSSGSDFQNGE